jgi:hypothetical protein
MFLISSTAQTPETFDIATFRSPGGWQRQNKDGVVIFNTSDDRKGTYAMIMLYRSGESSGNAASDFESDWQQFIAGQLGVKAEPQTEPVRRADGWEIITGGAAFQNELGTNAVILNTFSGYGKTFSVAAVFNSQDNVPAIEALISSVSLAKAATRSTQAPAGSDGAASILGTRGKSAGVHVTYGDPVSAGMAGYSKDQYTFNENGTYSYVSKTFRMAFDKILLVKESGTYQISGSDLTLSPQKSVIEAWSKRDGPDNWGALVTRQNRPLEKVTYRFTKHYFSGLQLWNQVLQADKPTDWDGPFSSNTLFSNAWYFAPISPNNPAVELPR